MYLYILFDANIFLGFSAKNETWPFSPQRFTDALAPVGWLSFGIWKRRAFGSLGKHPFRVGFLVEVAVPEQVVIVASRFHRMSFLGMSIYNI